MCSVGAVVNQQCKIIFYPKPPPQSISQTLPSHSYYNGLITFWPGWVIFRGIWCSGIPVSFSDLHKWAASWGERPLSIRFGWTACGFNTDAQLGLEIGGLTGSLLLHQQPEQSLFKWTRGRKTGSTHPEQPEWICNHKCTTRTESTFLLFQVILTATWKTEC